MREPDPGRHEQPCAPAGICFYLKTADAFPVLTPWNESVSSAVEEAEFPGADKGKRGKVIAVATKKSRVLVEGVRMIKRHMRKSQQHPQGAIVEREGGIHISNVMKADVYEARAAKRKTPTAA